MIGGKKVLEEGKFGHGLLLFFTRGKLVQETNVTTQSAMDMLEILTRAKEDTSLYFEEDDEKGLGEYLTTIQWVEERCMKVIDPNVKLKMRIYKRIAQVFKILIERYEHLPDYTEEANEMTKELYNKINKRWSESELCD